MVATRRAEDCDDGDRNVHPGAVALCNGIDNNCNGYADENAACEKQDSDKDGEPDTTDCNDNNDTIGHGEDEICNGVDDNCDGHVDEDSVCGTGGSAGNGGTRGTGGTGGTNGNGEITTCEVTFTWDSLQSDNVSWEPNSSALLKVRGTYTKADGSPWRRLGRVRLDLHHAEGQHGRLVLSVQAREATHSLHYPARRQVLRLRPVLVQWEREERGIARGVGGKTLAL